MGWQGFIALVRNESLDEIAEGETWMREQGWIGVAVLLLVVVLAVLTACSGNIQGETPGAGGGQAATPTKEDAPTASAAATETAASTPTKEDALAATVGATETVASKPTKSNVPTATVGATETVAATPTPEMAPTATMAALDGQALLQARCTVCHDTARIRQAKKTQTLWKTTVERMVGKGAQLTQAEQDAVVEYLTKTYPQ